MYIVYIYTASIDVCAVYPSALKIGDFSTKDETKTLSLIQYVCHEKMIFHMTLQM